MIEEENPRCKQFIAVEATSKRDGIGIEINIGYFAQISLV